MAELEWLDLHLRLQVDRARKLRGSDDPFAGLSISEDEVDAICVEPVGLPRWATAPRSESDVARALEELSLHLSARTLASIAERTPLRLEQIAALFDLDRVDRHILLIALAPEIDIRYERLFAYLQDDVTQRRPSVNLALNLISASLEDKIEHRARFSPQSSLLRHCLIGLFEDAARGHAPLLGKYVKIDERIAGYLLGSNDLDPALSRYARLLPRGSVPHDWALPSDVAQCVGDIIEQATAGESLLVHLRGPEGVGKLDCARTIADRSELPLLVLDGEQLAATQETGFDVVVERVNREAMLQGAALYFRGFDVLLADDRRFHRDLLLQALGRRGGLSFLSGHAAWNGLLPAGAPPLLRLELSLPTCAERLALWRNLLDGDLPADVAAQLGAVAAQFRLTQEAIRAAASSVCFHAHSARARNSKITTQDLLQEARARSTRNLGDLATKLKPRHRWADLVLPRDTMQQLREICEQIRHHAWVFDTWGFDKKLSLGRGLSALFAGPSGTGKTMAAGIIADELNLDLYKIDLSTVVSKYVGETEKNLARVFAEAEAGGAILLFDEADALFGKRTEVKDAHDRYANVETSYLLQRMEEHEGISILATNLRRNMDEAFLRRIGFLVQFPLPEEAERLKIWQGVLPPEMPRDSDVDLAFMASQFKFAGGNIRNVALAAAFLAAGEGSALSMRHLMRSTRRELQKMGKSCAPTEFGQYRTMVED